MKKAYGLIGTVALVTALALGGAQAKSSGSKHHVSSLAHRERAKHPSDTHIVNRACKTRSCLAKHPGGSYYKHVR